MYKKHNFNERPFNELRDFLKDNGIGEDVYRFYEYCTRRALDSYKEFYKFKEENLQTDFNKRSLEESWEFFRFNEEVEWGFHPFFSITNKKIVAVTLFEEHLRALRVDLPFGEELLGLQKLNEEIQKELENIQKKIKKIKEYINNSKDYKNEEMAYLTFSYLFARHFFVEDQINERIRNNQKYTPHRHFKINFPIRDFLRLKHNCYFQESELVTNRHIVEAVQNDRHFYNLEKHFISILEHGNNKIDTIMDAFMDAFMDEADLPKFLDKN